MDPFKYLYYSTTMEASARLSHVVTRQIQSLLNFSEIKQLTHCVGEKRFRAF